MRLLALVLSFILLPVLSGEVIGQSDDDSWEQIASELEHMDLDHCLHKARLFSAQHQRDSMIYYLEKARLMVLMERDTALLGELTRQLHMIYQDSKTARSGWGPATSVPGLASVSLKNELIILTSVIVGFLIFSIAILIAYMNQKEKTHRLVKKLRKKNKELTGASLKLLKQNMDIEHIGYKLRKLKSQQISVDGIERIAGSLTNLPQSQDQLWETFKFNFEEANEDFCSKINERHPNISQQDLKVCTLLRMNFSSKEVATFLGISYDGVRKARYRIRKKMDLSAEESLEKYLTSL